MDTATQILVIFLSVALAVLLVLSSIAVFLTIKLLKEIKLITDKAQHLIETAEHVGETFKHAAGPLALIRVISNLAGMVSKHNKRK